MIREGSMAVGATRWQTCRYHIVPYAMPGILTGVIIGLARAIGETAPIITIGALTFIAFLPPAPFMRRTGCRFVRLGAGPLYRDADPDLQLDLAPRPGL
jgi:ABC-type phosphate transport system permease subunit